MSHLNQIILLCRPGFEKECAGEIIEHANSQQFPAYIQTKDNTGIVFLISTTDSPVTELFNTVSFDTLIFARQWFASSKQLISLDDSDRLPAILGEITNIEDTITGLNFNDVELSYADTNEGKSLNKFCRQFQPHLLNTLKKKCLMSAHSAWRLHLLFIDSLNVYVGLTPMGNSARDSMGIPRLKMPGTAPSRSTLKMDEAIRWFLSTEQQSKLFKSGMTAVDLGAAPGGWSWQLVQRGCLVTAIDNGPMNDQLMKTGMVDHLKTDAFTYLPEKRVDWLVCDMAERPLHVSRLITRWFTSKRCSNAIFNLKLPMKKRLAAVNECIELIRKNMSSSGLTFSIQAKHLYHDREEITVCILCT